MSCASCRWPAQLAQLLVGLSDRPPAHAGHLTERLECRRALRGERPEPQKERLELVGRRLEVAEHRRLCLSQVAETAHVGRELGEECRQAVEARLQVIPP